jgi:hypothetical protein
LATELKAARNVRRAVKMQIASYADGLEDVLPEEVVKKANRAKRYYSADDMQAKEEPAVGADKVTRLTGQERLTREARKVLDDAAEGAEKHPQRKYSRAEKMLLERGDRFLQQN